MWRESYKLPEEKETKAVLKKILCFFLQHLVKCQNKWTFQAIKLKSTSSWKKLC